MAHHSSWTVGQQQPRNKHMHWISSHVDFSRGYTSGRLGKCFVGGRNSGLFSVCVHKEAQTFFNCVVLKLLSFCQNMSSPISSYREKEAFCTSRGSLLLSQLCNFLKDVAAALQPRPQPGPFLLLFSPLPPAAIGLITPVNTLLL